MKRKVVRQGSVTRVAPKEPIVEGLIEIPTDSAGRRMWSKVDDDTIIAYAENFIKENNIKRKKELERRHSALYLTLTRRKLSHRIQFEKKLKSWMHIADEELVEHTREMIVRTQITFLGELQKLEMSLYSVLTRRGVINKVGLKRKYRNWKNMSDDKFVEYVQGYVEENDVTGRDMLKSKDSGLYEALRKRKLINQIVFKVAERSWSKYSDEELVEYAQGYVEENDVESRSALQKKDNGLYCVLWRKGLIDQIKFEADERAWSKYSDEELVEYVQGYINENNVESRSALKSKDGGLYEALRKRKLIDQIRFEKRLRNWKEMSDDKFVEYAQGYVEENDVTGRDMLKSKDSGLYEALRKRKLLDQVFTEMETQQKADSDEQAAEEMLSAVKELDAA